MIQEQKYIQIDKTILQNQCMTVYRFRFCLKELFKLQNILEIHLTFLLKIYIINL